MIRRTLATVLTCTAFSVALVGCGDKSAPTQKKSDSNAEVTITVGASPVPHADILRFVSPQLKKQGVNLKVIEFTDYVKPNLALADGEIDANYFQHVPYLESFAKDRKLKLSILCSVHIEPMGIYSKKIKKISKLPKGSTVAIPNDPTNGGRALRVLADAGLIALKAGVGINGTLADIDLNKRNLKIIEMEAAVLPRALEDVDLSVINSNYAMGVGLVPTKDALFIEAKDSPYANVVVIRTGDNRKAMSKLAKALRRAEVRDYIKTKYNGAVYPTF